MNTFLRISGFALTVLALGSGGLAQRVGLLTTDTTDQTLSLAIPTAVGRALESIDGVVIPPPLEVEAYLDAKPKNKENLGRDFALSFTVRSKLEGRAGAYLLTLGFNRDGKDQQVQARGETFQKLVASADDVLIKGLGLKPSAADQKELDAAEKSMPDAAVVAVAAAVNSGKNLDVLEKAGDNPWALAARGLAATQAGKVDDGVALAAKAAKAAPTDLTVQVIFAAVQVYAGKYAEAKPILETILKLNPAKPEAHYLTGLVTLRTQKRSQDMLKAAGTSFGKAIAYNPRFLEAGLYLSEMYAQLNAPEKAIQSLLALVQRLPDEVTIHERIIQLFIENDRDQAPIYLLEVVTQVPDVPQDVYALAIRLPNAKDAMGIIEKGEKQYPQSALMAYSRGIMLDRTAKYADAVKAYSLALERNEKFTRAGLALAATLAKLGRFDEAENTLRKAQGDKFNDKVLARMYLTAGRFEKAGPIVAKLTAGSDPEVPYLTGLLALYNGQYDDAQKGFEAALKIKSDYDFAKRGLSELADARRLGTPKLEGDNLVRYRIGQAARDAGNPFEAVTQFKAVFEKAPNNPQVAFMLGVSLFETGEVDDSLEPLKQALKGLPNNPLVLTDLGLVYFQNGRFDLALDHLEKAVKADGKYARGWFWLGVTNFNLGYAQPAKEAILKAVALDSTLKEEAQKYLDALPK